MEYNAIISAIPSTFHKALKESKTNDNNKECELFYNMMKKRDGLTSLTYKSLIEFTPLEKKRLDWQADLQEVLSNDDYQGSFKNIYSVTNVSKLRSFQYRLLHRAIVLNSHLFHWKIKSSSNCTFCNQEKESYSHIFVLCTKVRNLWISLEKLMYDFSDNHIVFNVRNVMFNKLIPDLKNIKNFLCLLCKQYIYRQ